MASIIFYVKSSVQPLVAKNVFSS